MAALFIVPKPGSDSVSESAPMSCCARQRWGKPPVVRCSGVECSPTTRNGLCSRSWDRFTRQNGGGSDPGRCQSEAKRERRGASGGCGTPSSQLLEEGGARLAKKQEEGGTDAPMARLYLPQKCTVRFCSKSYSNGTQILLSDRVCLVLGKEGCLEGRVVVIGLVVIAE